MWEGLSPVDWGLLGPVWGVIAFGLFKIGEKVVERWSRQDEYEHNQAMAWTERVAEDYHRCVRDLGQRDKELAEVKGQLAECRARRLILEAENERLHERLDRVGTREEDRE